MLATARAVGLTVPTNALTVPGGAAPQLWTLTEFRHQLHNVRNVSKTGRTGGKSGGQSLAARKATAAMLKAERARWEMLSDSYPYAPTPRQLQVTKVRFVPSFEQQAGYVVSVKMTVQKAHRDPKTGERVPKKHPLKREELPALLEEIRGMYHAGQAAFGCAVVPWAVSEGADVTVLAKDPLDVLYGADMLHPDLRLPAPYLPAPQGLHDPLLIGADSDGKPVTLTIAADNHTCVFGLSGGGKSTMWRNADRQLMVRPDMTIDLAECEAGANGVSDFAHGRDAYRSYTQPKSPTELLAQLNAWVEWLSHLPADLDQHGAPLPKVITRHHLFRIDGTNHCDNAVWERISVCMKTVRKLGGQIVIVTQVAKKTDIPPAGGTVFSQAGTIIMLGRCNDPVIYRMAFGELAKATPIDMAHHKGPGRCTIQTGGVRTRCRLFNERVTTDGTTYPADIAYDALSRRARTAPGFRPDSTQTPPGPDPDQHPDSATTQSGPAPRNPKPGGVCDREPVDLSAVTDIARRIYGLVAGEQWPVAQTDVAKALGLDTATIRRHAAQLVDAGLLTRSGTSNRVTFHIPTV